jgi:hypothetical protein
VERLGDGYHQYLDVARKVFNKAENKKTWGKSPDRLNSSLDFDAILVKWQTQAGKGPDLRMSGSVGTYVCGFVYYTSLECFWKKGEGEMLVVFMHVSSLPEKDDVEKGAKVTIALIKGIAESIGKWNIAFIRSNNTDLVSFQFCRASPSGSHKSAKFNKSSDLTIIVSSIIPRFQTSSRTQSSRRSYSTYSYEARTSA